MDWKRIVNFLAGPLGFFADVGRFASNKIAGTDYRNRFDDFGNFVKTISEGGSSMSDLMEGINSTAGELGGALQSWVNTQTQQHMTGAQIEQNDWTAQREDTAYQRAVADMEAAGLNPAMMYGRGGQPAASSSSASPSTAGLGMSDLIQLLTIKPQIDLIKAQTRNVEQKTLTEEQITRIKTISADYGADYTEAEIESLYAGVANAYADVNLKSAKTDYVVTQTDAQNILNKHLEDKTVAEINAINANSEKLSSDASLNVARKVYQEWVNNFVKSNGFLPSTNDALLIGTYLCSLVGADKGTIQSVIKDAFDNIPVIKAHRFVKDWNTRMKAGNPAGYARGAGSR